MRTLVVVLIVALTGAQQYNGEERRTVPCTKVETARSAQAFNEMAVCSGVTTDELRKEIVAKKRAGAQVGDLKLSEVNDCLRLLKQGQKLTADCREVIRQLNNRADQPASSVSDRIAAKLVDDPAGFCSCMRAINVTGINCPGWGVVPAVGNITETCDLLQDPVVQEALRQGAANGWEDPTPSPTAAPQTPKPTTTATPPPTPLASAQPTSRPTTPTSPAPTPAPTPAPRTPQTPAPTPSESQTKMMCIQQFLTSCPDVKRTNQAENCLEKAVNRGELAQSCLAPVRDALEAAGDKFFDYADTLKNSKLTPDQQNCLLAVMDLCDDVDNEQQLRWCVKVGVQQGKIKPLCISFLASLQQ